MSKQTRRPLIDTSGLRRQRIRFTLLPDVEEEVEPTSWEQRSQNAESRPSEPTHLAAGWGPPLYPTTLEQDIHQNLPYYRQLSNLIDSGSPMQSKSLSLRRTKARSNLRMHVSSENSSDSQTSSSAPSLVFSEPFAPEIGLQPVFRLSHFKTFCLLDMQVPGHDVIYQSKEFRNLMRREQSLDLLGTVKARVRSQLSTTITHIDEAGQDKCLLLLYNLMHSMRADLAGVCLVTVIDITDIVDAAYHLADCFQDQKPGDLYLATGTDLTSVSSANGLHQFWLALEHDLKEDVLQEDVWLSLALEEDLVQHNSLAQQSLAQLSIGLPIHEIAHWSQESTASVLDSILSDFTGELLSLYTEFVILGEAVPGFRRKAIYYLSQSLSGASGDSDEPEYTIPLRTSILESSWPLSGKHEDFVVLDILRMRVRNSEEVRQKLYCIKLRGMEMQSWLCFLVDNRIPPLW